MSSEIYYRYIPVNVSSLHAAHYSSDLHKALNATIIFLSVCNILLHSLGTYLLATLYFNGKANAQKVYLLNLSLLLVCINILNCIYRIPHAIILYRESDSGIIETQMYIQIILSTGFYPIYYFNMFYLTIDRLLNVLLNAKYKVYWDETKAMYLVQITWIIGLVASICISVAYNYTKFYWEVVYWVYFYPTLDVIFIVLALITYSVLFWKYNMSQNFRAKNKGKLARNRLENSFQAFRRSRFYIAVLLILSFVVLVLIPHIVGFVYAYIHQEQAEMVISICWLLYLTSDLINAWVYIFVQRSIRTLLWKKLRTAITFFKKV